MHYKSGSKYLVFLLTFMQNSHRLMRYPKNINFIRKWHCLFVTVSTPELKLSRDLSYIKKPKHMFSVLRDPISHAYLSAIGVIDWKLESIVMSVVGVRHNRINGLLPLDVKHFSSQSDKYPIKINDMWLNIKSNIIMTHALRIYFPIVNNKYFLGKGILLYIKWLKVVF